MGPSIGKAIFGICLLAVLPLHDAIAERARPDVRPQREMAKAATAPTAALLLRGTYSLTTINSRPIRGADLARSTVTFAANGDVTVATACNNFSTRLQVRPVPGAILGFGQTGATTLSCPASLSQAEVTTTRLFRETANIARAGNSLTFFNSDGGAIAQWTSAAPSPAVPERRAPQFGAPDPVQVFFGDYVLTELNARPVATYPARGVVPTKGKMTTSEAAPTGLPANTHFSTSLPTLFLRESGQVMGGSGCNHYSSQIISTPSGAHQFGAVVSSKKACLNRTMGRLEGMFFAALRGAVRVDISASQIDLYKQNGTRSARLSSISARSQAGPSLYGINWVLRSLNNAPVTITNPPTMTFGNAKASGTTGCGNQFSVQHERQSGVSRFHNVIVTEMACRTETRRDIQSRFMTALTNVTQIDISTTTLTLRSPDQRSILVFDAP